MSGKFIVLILDGFGIGAMDDCIDVRPDDIGSNTFLNILNSRKNLKLKNLEKLGIMNIIGSESENMKFSKCAKYGSSKLTHFGADTFWGHQEIMGSKPLKPFMEPIANKINIIDITLTKLGYIVEKIIKDNRTLLLVNNALTIGDNIETDLGQAYNVTAALDLIGFSEVVKIGKIVRAVSLVSRVIVFGGYGILKENLLDSIEIKGDCYIGVNAPKSGVYKDRYHCIHLGYGVNYKGQLPYILGKNHINVTLIGKVADIVHNPYGENIPAVDTSEVMNIMFTKIKEIHSGFFCINVQETDLAGHEQDVNKYIKKLEIVDKNLDKILGVLTDEDILIIMADHGNDPTVGHSRHTRENVPLLIYNNKKEEGCFIGIRDSLSDIAQTASEFFTCTPLSNGTSFFNILL